MASFSSDPIDTPPTPPISKIVAIGSVPPGTVPGGQYLSVDSTGKTLVQSIPLPFNTSTSIPAGTPLLIRWLPEYRESMENGQQTITQQCDVDWLTRAYFTSALLGYSYQDPDTLALRRYLPYQHVDYPHLYAAKAECTAGIGVPGNRNGALAFYARDTGGNFVQDDQHGGIARYSVTFSSLPYDVATDAAVDATAGDATPSGELIRFVEREAMYVSESVVVPTGYFQVMTIQPDPTLPPAKGKINTLPAKPTASMELVYTWYGLPDVPQAAIENCLGKINATPFDDTVSTGSLGPFGAEQLLCVGARLERGRNLAGYYYYDIKYRFLWRPQSWRRILLAPMSYYLVNTNPDGSGKYVFDTADFNTLFQLP